MNNDEQEEALTIQYMSAKLDHIVEILANLQMQHHPQAGILSDPHYQSRTTRPPLPDPRLVRNIIRQRQLRARFFDGDIFADPAWDMLLDLTAARAEHKRVSVTSLCIASAVPPTTALRWISQLVEMGLFERIEDDADRRRAFIKISDKAAGAMARFFHDRGEIAI